jgi:hypothetical protein
MIIPCLGRQRPGLPSQEKLWVQALSTVRQSGFLCYRAQKPTGAGSEEPYRPQQQVSSLDWGQEGMNDVADVIWQDVTQVELCHSHPNPKYLRM